MKGVFISHSSKDKAFVLRLERRLKAYGIEVWVDDLELRAGDGLTDTIGRALRECRFVLVVLSRASLRSAWVRKEVALASKHKGANKPLLVPLLLEELEPSALPRAFRDTKYVVFTTPEVFETGLAHLVALLVPRKAPGKRSPRFEKVELIGADAIPSVLLSKATLTLERYQPYLRKVGFRAKYGSMELTFEETEEFISYYDPRYDRIVTNSKYAGEEDYLLRDYTHHALWTSNPDFQRGSAANAWALAAIESGLAAYFPCSYKNLHYFAESAAHMNKRTVPLFDLTNTRKIEEIEPNANSVATDGLEVWGGAFWHLRAELGARAADRVLWRGWIGMRPRAVRAEVEFVRSVLRAARDSYADRYAPKIRAVFRERGVRLTRSST